MPARNMPVTEYYIAALTREISSWPLQDKIHIHKRVCNILFII